LLPPPTLAPDLPKLNVVGLNPTIPLSRTFQLADNPTKVGVAAVAGLGAAY
jgi:hypothetical protein